MIVISQALILAQAAIEGPDAPLIGSHSLVAVDNVAASSAHASHPVTNLANPATDLLWQATAATSQQIEVTLASPVEIDYVGLAGHNLGTAGGAVLVEGDDGGGYAELAEQILPDDRPALFRVEKQSLQSLRITLGAGDVAAAIAVLHVGALTVVPRRIYVGHTPISYARDPNVVTGLSENGKYLGSIQVGGTSRSNIELKNLSPAWVRTELDPVIARRSPFFWAWRPTSYPLEVGYVWLTGAAKPVNQRANGMMSISLPIEGEA